MIKLIKMVMYLNSSSLIPPATSCFHLSLLSEPVIKQLQPECIEIVFFCCWASTVSVGWINRRL